MNSIWQFVAKKVPSVAISSTMLGSPAPDAGAINEQVSLSTFPLHQIIFDSFFSETFSFDWELYDAIFRYSDWCNLWELIQGEPKRWKYNHLLGMRMSLWWWCMMMMMLKMETGHLQSHVCPDKMTSPNTWHPLAPFIFWTQWSWWWCQRQCCWTWWW